MENCEFLPWFGALVLLLTAGLILIPYVRRKADLISAWNFLLLGIAIFVGLGCFEAAISPMRFHGLDWFQPTKGEVHWFLAATTVFLVALIAAYYFDPVSAAIAKRAFNKWPPISTPVLLVVLMICLVLAIASRVPALLQLTFIGPLLVNVSHKALVFSAVFSFVLWYRQRANLAWMILFLVVFASACLMAMLAGGGRRIILSVACGPIFVLYFYHGRHWRPAKTVIVIAVALFALFNLNLMYSTIRHFDRRGDRQERTVTNVLKQVKGTGPSDWYERFMSDALFHFSQQLVHYSMITDRFISMGILEPKPLNTLKFLVTYPVPRRIWAEKPKPLGGQIGVEVIPHFSRNSGIRWGCGVAGQAIYEGGIVQTIVFAYLAVLLVRFIDYPLRRDPTNPFLIAMLAAACTHLLGWPRGDLGVMSIEVIECFLFVLVLTLASRFFFGTDRVRNLVGDFTSIRSQSYSYPYAGQRVTILPIKR